MNCLKETLRGLFGVKASLVDIEGGNETFTEPTVFIIDYRLPGKRVGASFALPVGGYDKGENLIMNRCWIDKPMDQILRFDDGNFPNPHPDYGERSFRGRFFHPYSINTQGLKCDADNIKMIIERLYRHVRQ